MRSLSFSISAVLLILTGISSAQGAPLRFNRDVRPILSNHCFQCHGPDSANRKAGLRLDQREQALKPAESGEPAILPGKPDASELVRRIFATEKAEVMPPPAVHKELTAAQKEILKRWVAEGANYEPHWALIAPVRSELPEVKKKEWVRNGVDAFILARLEQEGLQPSPDADWVTLFRRLSLDLTGLPPRVNDVRQFEKEIAAAEAQPNGSKRGGPVDQVYERWVNRFLDSPHYGERMAVDWMDAARYADSNGYQVDRDRETYAWRDWVINAFNKNMPFDQFTIEQIAGDLLPEATLEQRVATGFHRNHMLNEEGGIIPEEFLAEYCADRVETTATVWLGQTFNCTRCHDHKFDPFTQKDFYGLYAFFHNVTEKGIGDYGANIRRNAPPQLKLKAPEVEAKIADLRKQIEAVRGQIATQEAELTAGIEGWGDRLMAERVAWQPVKLSSVTGNKDAAKLTEQGTARVTFPGTGTYKITAEMPVPAGAVTGYRLVLRSVPPESSPAKPVDPKTDKLSTEKLQVGPVQLFRVEADPKDPAKTNSAVITLTAGKVGKSLPSGEVAKTLEPKGATRAELEFPPQGKIALVYETEAMTVANAKGLRLETTLKIKEQVGPYDLAVEWTTSAHDLFVGQEVVDIVTKEPAARTEEEGKQLVDIRRGRHPLYRQLTARIGELEGQIGQEDLKIPTAMVMEELPQPRKTFIMMRGEYNKLGAEVQAATPAVLPVMPADWPRNRLGLARWLVDPKNPLPARVTVNRYWQGVFGTGLVRTAEDFGTQGEAPSHPELLDWLATEFIRTKWDVKGMMRLLVTSSAYRQSSVVSAGLVEKDPENRLLARGPRFRLQAEFLRDQALAASGLLVERVGGPSVKPYHPPGLYEQVVAGSSANSYEQGKGEDLFRRSLYTYWKRSVPNPAMLVFDAPFREACSMRRPRTNTPLQALNLMNDPTYVESARKLAERMIREGGSTVALQIDYGYRLVLGRGAKTRELAILIAAYDRTVGEFQKDSAQAVELLKVGTVPAESQIPPARLGALTVIASTLLNLDEAVMKE
ncbi:MAG: PSD1 and planctomycete cytochrome C domain-containing protein [Planctomycetales bacterium]